MSPEVEENYKQIKDQEESSLTSLIPQASIPTEYDFDEPVGEPVEESVDEHINKSTEFKETRYGRPTVYDPQRTKFRTLKKIWMAIKTSKLFKAYRHSRLNPYHWGLPKIIANTPEDANRIAQLMSVPQYIDKQGVRRNFNSGMTPEEEFKKTGQVIRPNGDVSSRIPKNEKGDLDLMAEEPILILIIPLEGASPVGHVCMQYKDRVINRRSKETNMRPLYPEYQDYARYYFVYPSQIGINPKKLIREMDKQNIRHGKDKYDLFLNNCATNVSIVLKNAGVKDINLLGIDKMGATISTPGNNPFHFGLKDWCDKYGVRVDLEEVAQLYKHHEIPDLKDRQQLFDDIRNRHASYVDALLRCKQSKVRYKLAALVDRTLGTKFKDKKIPVRVKRIEKRISDKIFGKD